MAKQRHRKICHHAILIGFNSAGDCVYSEAIPLDDYWDGEHVWDSSGGVKKLKLEKVIGFLFGQSGNLMQHFESTFDVETGEFQTGWARHEDGTITRR